MLFRIIYLCAAINILVLIALNIFRSNEDNGTLLPNNKSKLISNDRKKIFTNSISEEINQKITEKTSKIQISENRILDKNISDTLITSTHKNEIKQIDNTSLKDNNNDSYLNELRSEVKYNDDWYSAIGTLSEGNKLIYLKTIEYANKNSRNLLSNRSTGNLEPDKILFDPKLCGEFSGYIYNINQYKKEKINFKCFGKNIFFPPYASSEWEKVNYNKDSIEITISNNGPDKYLNNFYWRFQALANDGKQKLDTPFLVIETVDTINIMHIFQIIFLNNNKIIGNYYQLIGSDLNLVGTIEMKKIAENIF